MPFLILHFTAIAWFVSVIIRIGTNFADNTLALMAMSLAWGILLWTWVHIVLPWLMYPWRSHR